VKRVRPDSIVISYQGDGDLAAIGGNEILHSANRGENITVFFVNNGIYGMTGGQMAPTTPLGEKTTTSPYGRDIRIEGPPIRMCELLATLDGPVYIERVALTDPKHTMRARKAVRRALENQIQRKGFSFVEVLSACPTGWHVAPPEAIHWVETKMFPIFPLGVYKDAAGQDAGAAAPAAKRAEGAKAKPAGAEAKSVIEPGAIARGEAPAASLKISGFGGQGILFAGIALAEAGMREGLQVSWIPSYGPEMRGGTAHCHVRLSQGAIASPLINRPTTLMAFNAPSVERFAPEILPGGLLMVNSSMMQELPELPEVKVVAVPATEAAKNLGNPKVANMVMLGAYLKVTGALNPESILSALREHGLREDLLQFNRTAIQVGQDLV
jgi:2-oxoisovalerate ferredoxin oxidoreductase beta subunit